MSTSEAIDNAEATVNEVTTEVETPTEVTPTEEVVAAPDDDAAFEAGFNQAQGNEEPSEPEPEPEPTPTFASITEEELNDLRSKAAEVEKLREQQSKVFGSLGSLKQSIDALRNQPRPSATAVQLTKEKLARLGQAFPEMAEMLAEDLNGVLTGGGSSVDPSQVEQLVETKLSTQLKQQQQQFEAKVLSVMHPDWKQIVPSPEFAQWKQSLDESVRAELDNSWDAEFIGSQLSQFKDWKSKTAQANQSKQRRLAQAITPKGSPTPPAQTDEDAFFAGFKAARGR